MQAHNGVRIEFMYALDQYTYTTLSTTTTNIEYNGIHFDEPEYILPHDIKHRMLPHTTTTIPNSIVYIGPANYWK